MSYLCSISCTYLHTSLTATTIKISGDNSNIIASKIIDHTTRTINAKKSIIAVAHVVLLEIERKITYFFLHPYMRVTKQPRWQVRYYVTFMLDLNYTFEPTFNATAKCNHTRRAPRISYYESVRHMVSYTLMSKYRY